VNPSVLLVDKPAGPTSFGCVAKVRGALGGRTVKVGHAGTLDPFATGLLTLLVGRATRLAPYLSGLDKRYRVGAQLGVRSSTGDPEGELEPGTGPLPPREALERACAALTGVLAQVPPATSAIKLGGTRAYALARAGVAVELPPREVRVHAFDLVEHDAASGRAVLEVHCSKGTYVRSLVRDLGDGLGCGAYCSELRRTAVGHLELARAGALDDVAADPLGGTWRLSCAEALAHLPERALDERERSALLQGRAIAVHAEDGPVRCTAGGRLVCVAEPRGGELRSLVVVDEA
jgi:tRNA pseudouridine55 synthase